jgi:hypothetical protein
MNPFRTCLSAIKGNVLGLRFWRSVPDCEFSRRGFEVFPSFLDRVECARLVRLSDELLKPTSYRISGSCYTSVRSEAGVGRDTEVSNIYNINEVDAMVQQLLESRTIQNLFEARLGQRVEVLGFSTQRDGVDVNTKRDFHVDGLFPPVLKAFIYLTDVNDQGDGPYTVIPGSHRQFMRKIANDLWNAARGGVQGDMYRYAQPEELETILGAAGTLILSTQDLMHKGWQNHWRAPRYALIAHATTAKYFHGQPVTLGISRLKE